MLIRKVEKFLRQHDMPRTIHASCSICATAASRAK
jgi:hypothetical protein